MNTALSDRYTKSETYSKEQLNDLITTPDVNYVSVVATNATTAVTDILPATGEANTIYRVGNWNGTQYDPTMYALCAWNGTTYICLAVRSSVGEVYDVSVNHPDGQGNPTPYADLAAALGTNGANIPAGIRRGGMSIKFIQGTVQSSDNNYVQFRYMLPYGGNTTAENNKFVNPTNWQGVDDEPTAGSKNLVESGGAYNNSANISLIQGTNIPFTHRAYVGVAAGNIMYSYAYTNYLMIEFPTEYLKSCSIINNDYRIAYVALHEQFLPTSVFENFEVNATTFDFETACQSISEFVPKHAIVLIKKTNNSDLTGITSVDDIIGFELKENTNISVFKKTVVAVTAKMGFPTVENGKITFLQDTGINIFYLSHPIEYIVFNADTTFEFDPTKSKRLIVRNGEIIMESNNVHLTGDIILLQYSHVVKDFTGGWLYEFYLNTRVENNIQEFVTAESEPFISSASIVLNNYNIGDVVSITPVSQAANYSYAIVEVNGVTSALVKTKGGIAPRAWAFLDKDCKLISVADSSVTIDKLLDVPENAQYLVVNTVDNSKTHYCVVNRRNDNLEYEYTTFTPSWIGGNPIYVGAPSAKFVFGTNETSALQFIHSRIFRVLHGDSITVEGLNANKELTYAVYDANWTRINTAVIHSFDSNITSVMIDVEENAKYIVFQGRHRIEGVFYRDMNITISMHLNTANPYSFAPRSSDEGYQHLTMCVGINNMSSNSYTPSNELQVETEYYVDNGVLCLPESYSEDGEPTRLIVFSHGHAVIYNNGATRFDSNDIKPEYWLSEGYAIMDMDGSVTGAFSGNHDYEPASVNAYDTAYQWIIRHYNIRTDGVFSTGRSQGGGMQFVLARMSTMPILAVAPMVPVTSPLGYMLLPMTGSARKELLKSYGVPQSVLDAITWTSASTNYYNLSVAERNLIVEYQRLIAPYAPGYCINRPFTDEEFCDWSHAWAFDTGTYLSDLTNSIKDGINIAGYRSIPIRMYTCVGDTLVNYKTVTWLHEVLSRAGYDVQIHVFPATAVPYPNAGDHRFEINSENLVTYTNSKGVTLENVPKVYIETLAFWRRFENQDSVD